MEDIACLDSTMILLTNYTLPITSSLNPIVASDNEICSILVQLVSTDLYFVNMDICLAVFLPKKVVNDYIGKLSR